MKPSTLIIAVVILGIFILLKQLGQAKSEEVKRLAAAGGRVIDVRTEAEFKAGHLSQATNIPLGEISGRIAGAAPDKNQPLLLHCASGTRSAAACKILQKMGYTQVVNVGSYGRARALLQNP